MLVLSVICNTSSSVLEFLQLYKVVFDTLTNVMYCTEL